MPKFLFLSGSSQKSQPDLKTKITILDKQQNKIKQKTKQNKTKTKPDETKQKDTQIN